MRLLLTRFLSLVRFTTEVAVGIVNPERATAACGVNTGCF
jgi:hypothetical protein